jgi:hypothetical protein
MRQGTAPRPFRRLNAGCVAARLQRVGLHPQRLQLRPTLRLRALTRARLLSGTRPIAPHPPPPPSY